MHKDLVGGVEEGTSEATREICICWTLLQAGLVMMHFRGKRLVCSKVMQPQRLTRHGATCLITTENTLKNISDILTNITKENKILCT
jgi:hypothetical protein